MGIHYHPSPNYTQRRGGLVPEWIVLHYTAMETAQAAIDRLCSPEHEVSAHYVICERGRITQLVDETMRAWHAGQSYWRGITDMNSASIGIELANLGNHPYPIPQIRALTELLGNITSRWDIPTQNIIGHSDIAMGRKTDPGARFDWRGLWRQGFGLWSDVQTGHPIDPMAFQSNAQRVGYALDVLGTQLSAFRRHHAPHRTGPLSVADCAQMADLARQIPVDAPIATA